MKTQLTHKEGNMNEIVEKLYDAITAKQEKFMGALEALGADNALTRIYFRELEGMKEAFEIVAGESYIDYFCRKVGV